MGLVDIKDRVVDFWYDNKILRQITKIGGCVLVVGAIAIPAFMNTSKSLNNCQNNNHAANMCPNAISLLESGKSIDGLIHQYDHLLKLQGIKQENGDVITDVNIQLDSRFYTLPEGYEDYVLEGDKAIKVESINEDAENLNYDEIYNHSLRESSNLVPNSFLSFDDKGNPVLVKIIKAQEHVICPFISYVLTDKDGIVYNCTYIYYDGNYYQTRTISGQKFVKDEDIALVKKLENN